MAPHIEKKSSLKRGRVCWQMTPGFLPITANSAAEQASADSQAQDAKKPRRSQRIQSQSQQTHTPVDQDYLPTPLTNRGSTITDIRDDATPTPPGASRRSHQRLPSNPEPSQNQSSPPSDTQVMSQFVYPPRAFVDDVGDEAAEGVWGYLIPMNDKAGKILVLRKRDGCADRVNVSSKATIGKGAQQKGKNSKDNDKHAQTSPNGYLVGRHPECGKSGPQRYYVDSD